MSHLSDDELTLLHYGEAIGDLHLDECAECRERYDSLRRVLAAVEMPAPERGAEYGAEVWGRIESRIEKRGVREAALGFPAAATLVLLLGSAFEAGRF